MNFPKAKISAPALLCWVAWGIILCSQFTVLGPIMHETDQASLLSGAWKLAHADANPLQASFYNYDKQYLTYAYVALWLKALPDADPVWVGNLSTFFIFWLALALVLLRYPPRTFPQAAAVCAALLAPAFWQHSAFLASNFLAAALLIFGFCAWTPKSLKRRVLSVLLLGGAVASRGDALALLPLMGWLLLPKRRWLLHPWLWAMACAGILAFLLGRMIGTNSVVDLYNVFFVPKVFAAYVIFGLGAGALLLAIWMVSFLKVATTRRRWLDRIFYLMGAAAFLPLFGYYSLQMFSTRHWVTLLAGLLLAALSRRAPVIFQNPFLGVLLLGFAFLPVWIGIDLPSPQKPSLKMGPGTRFPSADGNLTMGGYLPSLLEMRRLNFAHDHNHPIWTGLRLTDFPESPHSPIPFLSTPMLAYYELAATLRHQSCLTVPDSAPVFFVDSRSVLRSVPSISDGSRFTTGQLLNSRRLVPVSPSEHGYRILRAEPGSPTPEMQHLANFAEAFEGNEFRILPRPEDARSPQWQGHRIVLFRDGKFQAISAEELATLSDSQLTQTEAAVSVLPTYMFGQKLR